MCIYECRYTCTHVCMYVCEYTCMYACMRRVYVSGWMPACMLTLMCLSACVHAQKHELMHTPKCINKHLIHTITLMRNTPKTQHVLVSSLLLIYAAPHLHSKWCSPKQKTDVANASSVIYMKEKKRCLFTTNNEFASENLNRIKNCISM